MTKTLKDLLQQAKDQRGVTSGRALADLTTGREHTIDRTQVNQILAGTYKSELRPSTLRAIAWLAGVDEAEAFAAAEQPVPGPPFAKELPPKADYLTPMQRDAVITVIRALLGSAEQEEVMGNAEHPAPTTLTTRRGGKSNSTATNPVAPLSDESSTVEAPPLRVAKRPTPRKRKE